MRVFVSYRRNDTQDFAGRLADRLRETSGVGGLFLDVDGIDPGEKFETKLRAVLAKCDICLVVIGTDWRGSGAVVKGPRIFEPGDFVRLEVREALRGPAKIIPVLANDAVMPRSEELPEDLRDLVKLNPISVRHSDFDRDVDHLLNVMFSRRKPGRVRAYLDRHPIQSHLLRAAIGLAAAFVALVIVATVHFSLTGQSLDETVGGPGPTVILIFGVLAIGAALPGVIRRVGRRRV